MFAAIKLNTPSKFIIDAAAPDGKNVTLATNVVRLVKMLILNDSIADMNELIVVHKNDKNVVDRACTGVRSVYNICCTKDVALIARIVLK